MKPLLVVNSSPRIALIAALPDFDQLAGLVGRYIVPAEVIVDMEGVVEAELRRQGRS